MMNLTTYVHASENGKAYIFSDGACNFLIEYEYNWGDLAIELISLDKEDIRKIYKEIVDEFSEIYESLTETSNLIVERKKLCDRFAVIDTKYPSLFIHTHILHSVLFNAIFPNLEDFSVHPFLLCTESYNRHRNRYFNAELWDYSTRQIKVTSTDPSRYFHLALDSIMDDVILVQGMVKKKIEHMYFLNGDLRKYNFSPAQRLAYYEYSTGANFQDQLRVAEYVFSKCVQKNYSSAKRIHEFNDNLLEEIKRVEHPIIEVYNIQTTLDLFALDIYMITMNNGVVEQCAYCNRFFIPRSKHKIKYCNRIAPGETLPCDVIGAKRTYERKQVVNPIYSAYDRAYKRLYARTRNRILSREDFTLWAEEARIMREKCFRGEISLDAYNKWLGNKN